MKTPHPTPQEVHDLISFLPRLYPDGVTAIEPIERWCGGTPGPDGVISMPWPEYREVVTEFFRRVPSECWRDYTYRPEEAMPMVKNADFISSANIDQIKTMLTCCHRGERFCDGHWGAMIRDGYIRRLLVRLTELTGC